ncbi:MAG: SsrA-binding protein [Propionibacteriaceae bacterium]|nr:SsrA-binding protein [Propionibacteriaceae bacterium]
MKSIEIKNKRAKFDYEWLDTYTAGMQLLGQIVDPLGHDRLDGSAGGVGQVAGVVVHHGDSGPWVTCGQARDRQLAKTARPEDDKGARHHCKPYQTDCHATREGAAVEPLGCSTGRV